MDLSARGIGLVVATATSLPAPWRWAAEELPATPVIEEVAGPSLVPPPARLILPLPWWGDDGAIPATPGIEDQGGYQPARPPRISIAWPPPQGDEALPVAAAALGIDEGGWWPLIPMLSTIPPRQAITDEAVLPIAAAPLALADEGWTLGRAIETGWEPGPTWLIDASEVVGPTVEEHPWLRLAPVVPWTPPVAPWRWTEEALPIAAAPLGIDEGEWLRLVPPAAVAPPRLAARDDHVLPIAAAPLALDEGTWLQLSARPAPVPASPPQGEEVLPGAVVTIVAEDAPLPTPPQLWTLILPVPWWYDDGAVPATPCIDDQAGYEPRVPFTVAVAWPPPQGDETLPIAPPPLGIEDDAPGIVPAWPITAALPPPWWYEEFPVLSAAATTVTHGKYGPEHAAALADIGSAGSG